MSAPTLISYTDAGDGWVIGNATKNATVSYLTNDVIVVIAGSEANDTLGTPTASGLSFTKQKNNAAAGTCAAFVATAVAASNGTNVTISVTNANSSNHWGLGVWVWRGSAGVGNSAEQHTTTKTVALTPNAADGGIVWASFDFNSGTGGSITPTPTNTRQNTADAAHYALYVSDLADQTSAGATSYGTSGETGTGPYSIVVLEIKASAVVVTGGGSLLLMGVGN